MHSNLFKVSLLAAALSLAACGGDDNNNNSPVETPEVTQKQTVSGTITDASGNPLADATLMLADQSVTTDASGAYSFDLANITDKVVVFVKKSGYLSLARELIIIPDQSYSLDMALSPDQIATSFDNSAGISNLLVSGATVTIPANAVSYEDGTPFLGTVDIAANYYNPDSIEGAQSFAQPFTGQNADGSNETGLVTVGVIDVKLTDPATGNELNLKSGTTATLTYPSASTDQDLDTIPLWYYDEDKMIWVKDGSATRQEDGSYRGEVSHFTLWNLDVPIDGYKALVEGCVVDATTKAPFTGNFYANVRGRGFHNSGSAGNNDGKFSFYVPINTPLELYPTPNSARFDAVMIPALDQNVTYKINGGNCIEATRSTPTKIIDYSNILINAFNTLPPAPTPTPSNPTPQPSPFTPPTTAVSNNIIGYNFTLDLDFDNFNRAFLDNIVMTTTYDTTNNIEYTQQSLYKQPNYNNDQIVLLNSLEEGLILTTQGISDSVNIVSNSPNTLTIQSLNTNFDNNSLTQSLDNGFKLTTGFFDKPLAGQSIGNYIARENVEDEFVSDRLFNKINNLPSTLSTFDGAASCKTELPVLPDMSFITLNQALVKTDNYDPEADYLDTLVKGVWNGIAWGRGYLQDDESVAAYVKYNNRIYSGEYYDYYADKDRDINSDCVFYNEAAKDQILAAIQAAYPDL